MDRRLDVAFAIDCEVALSGAVWAACGAAELAEPVVVFCPSTVKSLDLGALDPADEDACQIKGLVTDDELEMLLMLAAPYA